MQEKLLCLRLNDVQKDTIRKLYLQRAQEDAPVNARGLGYATEIVLQAAKHGLPEDAAPPQIRDALKRAERAIYKEEKNQKAQRIPLSPKKNHGNAPPFANVNSEKKSKRTEGVVEAQPKRAAEEMSNVVGELIVPPPPLKRQCTARLFLTEERARWMQKEGVLGNFPEEARLKMLENNPLALLAYVAVQSAPKP